MPFEIGTSRVVYVDNVCFCLSLRQACFILGFIGLGLHSVVVIEKDVVLYKQGNPLSGLDYIMLTLFFLSAILGDMFLISSAIADSVSLLEGYIFSSGIESFVDFVIFILFVDRAWGDTKSILIALTIYLLYCSVFGSYCYVSTRGFYQRMKNRESELEAPHLPHSNIADTGRITTVFINRKNEIGANNSISNPVTTSQSTNEEVNKNDGKTVDR